MIDRHGVGKNLYGKRYQRHQDIRGDDPRKHEALRQLSSSYGMKDEVEATKACMCCIPAVYMYNRSARSTY